MASPTRVPKNHEIKLLKVDGPHQGGPDSTKSEEPSSYNGTMVVEPDNAPSPHEVAVPSLDRFDLNENSNSAAEELSEVAIPSLDRLDLNENSNISAEELSEDNGPRRSKFKRTARPPLRDASFWFGDNTELYGDFPEHLLGC